MAYKKLALASLSWDTALIAAGIFTFINSSKQQQTNRQIVGLGMMIMGYAGIQVSRDYVEQQFGVK